MKVPNGKLGRSRALFCVGIVVLLMGVWIGFNKPVPVVSRTLLAITPPDAARLPRPIFRYSVIPGGVYSVEELARSRRLDPVVAAHYADFASSGVTIAAVEKDTWLYVSYRKGNRVYWTTKKHRIPKGEAVLSDGKNMARARCGNRLSVNPHMPFFDLSPPTEQALNTPEANQPPEFGAPPEFAPVLDAADLPLAAGEPIAGLYNPGPTTRSGATAETPLGPAPYFPPSIFPFAAGPFFPGFGIAPPGGGSGGSGTGGTGTGGTGGGGAGPPPVIGGAAVPEPFSAALMLIGAAALISLRRTRA